jgi:hypothetical protein
MSRCILLVTERMTLWGPLWCTAMQHHCEAALQYTGVSRLVVTTWLHCMGFANIQA